MIRRRSLRRGHARHRQELLDCLEGRMRNFTRMNGQGNFDWRVQCAERPRVLAPLVISKGGRLTSQKPARCRGLAFFAPLPPDSSKLGRSSWPQKSQRVGAGFWLVRRDRDSNSGTKKIGHSLAGCCITTLPPLQEIPLRGSRACDLREGKNSEILSCAMRQNAGVRILSIPKASLPAV